MICIIFFCFESSNAIICVQTAAKSCDLIGKCDYKADCHNAL